VKRVAALYQLARADFLERTRTFQYLATLAITLWIGSAMVPPLSAKYIALAVDNYRGIYNSAWMGIMFAILMTTLLTLFGFYLIKSAVQRDRKTRVGEIIASTSVGKFEYVLGKTISNFAVLLSIAAMLLVDAVVMQLVRGEDRHLDLIAIVWPTVVFVIPVFALIAAVAVLFEVLPILRGGIGNVVYFFLWTGLLAAGARGSNMGTRGTPLDVFGFAAMTHGVWQDLSRIDRRATPNDIAVIDWSSKGLGTHTFVFNGMTIGGDVMVDRLVALLVALLLVALAALCFDRFSSTQRARAGRKPSVFANAADCVARITRPVLDIVFATSFGSLLLAELRLMLKGSNFWWYVVSVGLWFFTVFAPSTMQSTALAIAWIWPILIFSQMGTRETMHQTEQLVYPSLHPLRRQFAAQLCAGIAITLLIGSGAIVRDLAIGNTGGMLAAIVAALFIPTLALACGALSGTTRLFEVTYLILWYVGPMNDTPIDYTKPEAMVPYAIATALLLVLAFYSRSVRLAMA
jgi:flagellar biogenesis protein FliO